MTEQIGTQDVKRAERIADDFQPSEHYDHLIQLRDSDDPRWQQAGTHTQIATAMYEQQRATARQNGRNL